MRWREIVELGVLLATVRAIVGVVQERLDGPGRTREQVHHKVDTDLAALSLVTAWGPSANRIHDELTERQTSLKAANVVLLYEEHAYLQLTGIRDGHSIRRHLPRGLHLIFSDQEHRRTDRIERTEAISADRYTWAKAVPDLKNNAGLLGFQSLPPNYLYHIMSILSREQNKRLGGNRFTSRLQMILLANSA